MTRYSSTSVRKYTISIGLKISCWRLLLVLSAIAFHSLEVSNGWGQVENGSGKVADRNWIEQVEPGVQLIGRPKSVRNYLDSNTFTMTPDGKMLVGARGRELCVIDWDAQKLIRSVKMPFQLGSASASRFLFSGNGRYLMVMVDWNGRPYDPAEQRDLDEFQDYRLEREFPNEKFRGNRLLIYNSDYELLHDLELTYNPDRIQDPKAPVQHWVSDIFVYGDDSRAVVLGYPLTRVINLETGKVVHEQQLGARAISVGDQVLSIETQDGIPTGFWWDPASNVVSEEKELKFTKSSMLFRSLEADKCFSIYNQDEGGLTIRSLDRRVEIQVPLRPWMNINTGTYSRDGRYFIFCASNYTEKTVYLIDLVQQKILFQIEITPEHWFHLSFFRPLHNTLLVQVGPQISELKVDEDFETNLRAVARLLPKGGQLQFANNDTLLAVGRDDVVDLRDATSQRPGPRQCETFAVSPFSNLLVQETGVYLNGVTWTQIEVGPIDNSDSKRLYSNVPASVPAILQRVLGISNAEDDAEKGKWLGVYTTHLSFSSDGETLRQVYTDCVRSLRLRLTHFKSRRLIEDRALDSKIILARAIMSADGRWVAVFRNHDLEILDAADGQLIRQLSFPESIDEVRFDRRGELIAIMMPGDDQSVVQVINMATGKTIFREDYVQPVGFGFRPGSNQFYVANREKSGNRLRLFDRETWDVAWEHTTNYGSAYSMAMSNDGTQAAFGLSSCHIELWKLSEIQPEE